VVLGGGEGKGGGRGGGRLQKKEKKTWSGCFEAEAADEKKKREEKNRGRVSIA